MTQLLARYYQGDEMVASNELAKTPTSRQTWRK